MAALMAPMALIVQTLRTAPMPLIPLIARTPAMDDLLRVTFHG